VNVFNYVVVAVSFVVLLIAVGALVSGPGPGHRHGPSIVSSSQKRTEACAEDPLSPCMTEVVVIHNPLFVPVVVTLCCGVDDEQDVLVPARVELTVDIELTEPSATVPTCTMTSWRK
jgi:hypothetical protein